MDKTWKARKLDYISRRYSPYLKNCEGCTDDRGIYMSLYEMIIEALQSLPEEPNNYVCVAMNKKLTVDMYTLDKIIRRFWNKDLRSR